MITKNKIITPSHNNLFLLYFFAATVLCLSSALEAHQGTLRRGLGVGADQALVSSSSSSRSLEEEINIKAIDTLITNNPTTEEVNSVSTTTDENNDGTQLLPEVELEVEEIDTLFTSSPIDGVNNGDSLLPELEVEIAVLDGDENDTNVTDWSKIAWTDLPDTIKESATTLGFNETNWETIATINDYDSATGLPKIFSNGLYWDELSIEVQNAASVLLKVNESWWNEWESVYSDTGRNWTKYDWIGLPDDIQNALASLGCNISCWDDQENPFNVGYWDELSKEQQLDAYEIYGSNEASWNGWFNVTSWDNFGWFGLPDKMRVYADLLGYDQFSWDNGIPSEVEMFYWNDLSPEQQSAAMTLFQEDEASWNGWDYEVDENGNNIYMNDWEDYGWSGLPQAIKDAMTVLGWDESLWDNGESVSTDDMMWIELSSTQQDAAGLYGYDQQTWDAERTEDGQEEEEGELTMADYNDMYWDDLPQEIKDAMTVLGWSKKAWNQDESVSTESMMWSELSSDQQEAAELSGYDQQTWDADVQEEEGEQEGEQEQEKEQEEEEEEVELTMADYENMYWGELPQEIKDAMMVLGWSESAWNNGESVSTESMMWSELSSDQREAAELYGSDQQTWDADVQEEEQEDDPDDPEEEEEVELTMADYENMYWDDLPQEIKDAMMVLGWSKSAWNNDESVSTESMMWSELSSDQQEAAELYGYNQQNWDADITEEGQGEEELTMDDYKEMDWDNLPQEIKETMMILGFNNNVWNTGGKLQFVNKSWAELSFEEQAAARLYGYTEQTWDAEFNINGTEEDDSSSYCSSTSFGSITFLFSVVLLWWW